jgi:hypothetical protein
VNPILLDQILLPRHIGNVVFCHFNNAGRRLRFAAVPVVAMQAISFFRFDKGSLALHDANPFNIVELLPVLFFRLPEVNAALGIKPEIRCIAE